MSTAAAATGNGMLQVEEARQTLLDAVAPRDTSSEPVSLDAAEGRILAEDLTATIAVPSWDNSAMDGYAVRTADLSEDPGVELPVSQYIPAGQAPKPLRSGTAARIFTGAPVPENADAVIMQENCTALDGRVRIDKPVEAGANIRAAGEDIRQGATILTAGRRLQPQDIALAASVGIPQLPVRRPLRIAVLATGDELVPPGETLGAGQIHDSNGPLMAGLVRRIGCELVHSCRVADTSEATREALNSAAADADLILTSGGVSVGEEDHVKAAIESLGSLELWKIAVKPGKPLAFGHLGNTPLIGLPGNPVSLFVTFLLFAAPVIRRLQGRDTLFPKPAPVPAGFECDKPGKREEYLRVRLSKGRLEAFPKQGSGVLSSAVWADGLAQVPAGARISPGDVVDFFSFSDLVF